MRDDIQAFDGLMEEAAQTLPKGVYDNPKRTVLTHFLDFGGSDRFFPMIEAWKKKGWVSEFMRCAIHRARYRGVADKDPVEADRAADVCLEEARSGAEDPELRWKIEACLEAAPFLTLDSTVALSRYIAMAADPTEPYLFREALLREMTTVYLQDPGILRANDPAMPRALADRKSRSQLEEASRRFDGILEAVRSGSDPTLIAGATSFGALEIERVNVGMKKSFIAKYAESDLPEDADLAWGWVRAVKAREYNPRLDTLGVYDRKREPKDDAYWYVCFDKKPDRARVALEAATILVKSPTVNKEALRQKACVDPKTKALMASIVGPYPLELTARAAATASVAHGLGDRIDVRVTLNRRVIP